MNSPLAKFKNWYLSLPPGHQSEIASIAGIYCAGFEGIDYRMAPDDMPFEFIKIIDALDSDYHKSAGVSISLRAFFDHFIYRRRSNKEGWKENEAIMKTLASEHQCDNFERMGNEMEFRGKQWVSTCEKWKEFRDKELSDEQIEDFIKERAFKS